MPRGILFTLVIVSGTVLGEDKKPFKQEGKEDEYLERLIDYFNVEGIAYKDFEYQKSKIVGSKEGRVTVDF